MTISGATAFRWTLAAVLLLTACDGSPTDGGKGPGGKDDLIAYDQVVSGTVASPADTAEARFRAQAGDDFAVTFAVPGSAPLSLQVIQETTGAVSATAVSASSSLDAAGATQRIHAETAGTYRLRISTIGTSAGGTFQVRVIRYNGGPEKGSGEIVPGAMIEGESLDYLTDRDEFTFTAPVEGVVEVYAQETGATVGAMGMALAALPDQGLPLDAVTIFPVGPTQDIDASASGRIALTPGKRYRVSVAGSGIFGSYVGPYRFQVLPINPGPEHSAVALTPGDTLETEAIERVGDQDDFTLSGAPGTEYNLFVQGGGASPRHVTASIADPEKPNDPPAASSYPDDGPLLDHPSGTFAIPASGSVTVHVADAFDRRGLYRGPYRLYAHPVDRRPEGASATLPTNGGSVASAIEVRGDVDEYHTVVTSSGAYDLVLVKPAGSASGVLRASLVSDATGREVTLAQIYPAAGPGAPLVGLSQRVVLDPGPYTVRVYAASTGDGYAGRYAVDLHRLNPDPEQGSVALTIGDTLRADAIRPAGDLDTYTFQARAGDTLQVIMRPSSSSANFLMEVTDPTGNDASAFTNYTRYNRFVTVAGMYTVRVSAAYTDSPADTGAYRLILRRITAAPEHVPPTFALGDSIGAESIDFPGDLDQLVMSGAPGAKFVAQFHWGGPFARATFDMFDAASGQALASIENYGMEWSVSPTLSMPAGGKVRVRIHECDSLDVCFHGQVGTYAFKTYAIDPHPEGRSAVIAFGDTVAEALSPMGDVDEYTFTGVGGHTVDVDFQLPGSNSGSKDIQLVDPSTGRVLGSFTAVNGGLPLDQVGIRGVTLPHNGTYMIRVQSTLYATQGSYHFRMTDRG